MVAVDTNVLLRLVLDDAEEQVASAEAFIAQGVWISTVVLVEAIWVLRRSYNFAHADLADLIEMLLNDGEFVIQEPDVVTAALTVYRDRPSLGFSDCLILEIARKAGHLPLGTFDRALARVAGAVAL